MKYLTKNRFLKKVEALKVSNPEHWGNINKVPGQPVATERWSYHQKAISLLKLIEPKTVLEAGSMGIFLTKSSDSIDLDIPDWGWRLTYEPTYNYDLTQIPWKPIKDKQYDVFVALRVFHHMKDEAKYLKEMERISNHIILALDATSADRYITVKKPDLIYFFVDTGTFILYYNNEN